LKVINDWLTAKLLRSPSDGYTMSVTYLSVFGKRRAQTLAITAHIASARIQHAPEIIRRQNTHKLVVSLFLFFFFWLAQQNCVQLFVLFFLINEIPCIFVFEMCAHSTQNHNVKEVKVVSSNLLFNVVFNGHFSVTLFK
jgi:hypothetical protein